MKANPKVSRTIAAILSASAMSLGAATHSARAAESDAGAAEADALQTITVTAQRRSESIQDVPLTVTAMTGEQLKELNVFSFDDVVKYLPNVTFGANGPGQGDIFMRGLSAGGNGGNQSSASYLPFPNVALYLDDQSVQFPGRNLDVYMVDMERIEVLEGPQGTLFGGGAEAGAVRYITNKPRLDALSGNIEASYGLTTHGDPNQSVNATLNVPIVGGVFALRGVIYDDHRGGYIDNLPSTFTRSNNDAGSSFGIPVVNGVCPAYPVSNGLPTSTGLCVPGNSQIANNYNLARNAQNPVNYGGARIEGLLKITDDWNVLVSQSFQNMEADGSFAQYPYGSDYGVTPSTPQLLGPWQGTFFAPIYYKDKFENTALTVNGMIGDLKLVYSGAFLMRHMEQSSDYTNYTRSGSGYYYTCQGGPNMIAGGAPTCYSPIASWYDHTRNSHLSNELRLTTPDNLRLRGLFGVYQENFNILDDMNFEYRSLPECTTANLAIAAAGGPHCLADIGPVPGPLDANSNPRNSQVAYGEDERRGYSQYAAFTSIDFDIIPKVLTLTGGTRYYHYHEYEFGTRYTTTSDCVDVPVCAPGGVPTIYGGGNVIKPPNTTYHGFRSRGNLTWHITQDVMAYYTFSQGFRPGGFNRFIKKVGNAPVNNPDGTFSKGPAQFASPYSYAPDSLTNSEVGLKSEWFNHRLQLNLSAYHMKWDNAQFVFFAPEEGFGNSNFVVNGPNYTINGGEAQLAFKPIDGLTVQASGAWNSATQDNSVCIPINIAGVPNYGNCISETFHGGKVYNITSPLGQPNSRPPFSPAIEFSVRARYDVVFANDYVGFITVGASHVGSMNNEPVGYPPGTVNGQPVIPSGSTREFFVQPGYTTYDASLGVNKDRWTASLFGQNLSNSDASTYTSSAQYIQMQVPLRPRVMGLKVNYQF
jgi:outer membrane receptor protein involved in Fe transport